MKKTIAVILIILCILSIGTVVFGTEVNTLENNNKNDVEEMKSKMEVKREEYTEKYGSDAYWLAGFIIEEIVQPYSIPFCFIGIVVGLLFQYVLGTRRLDYKHRGFSTVIVFVTILLILLRKCVSYHKNPHLSNPFTKPSHTNQPSNTATMASTRNSSLPPSHPAQR